MGNWLFVALCKKCKSTYQRNRNSHQWQQLMRISVYLIRCLCRTYPIDTSTYSVYNACNCYLLLYCTFIAQRLKMHNFHTCFSASCCCLQYCYHDLLYLYNCCCIFSLPIVQFSEHQQQAEAVGGNRRISKTVPCCLGGE